jgi:hypothetical protein
MDTIIDTADLAAAVIWQTSFRDATLIIEQLKERQKLLSATTSTSTQKEKGARLLVLINNIEGS